jgi:hypothetical protein
LTTAPLQLFFYDVHDTCSVFFFLRVTTCLQGKALSGPHPAWASAPDMWAPEVSSLPEKGSALFFADSQAKDNACEGA